MVGARDKWVFPIILVTDSSRETNRFWYVDCLFPTIMDSHAFPPSALRRASWSMVDVGLKVMLVNL